MAEQNKDYREHGKLFSEVRANLQPHGPPVDHRKLADFFTGGLDASSRQEVVDNISTYRDWDDAFTDMRILLAEKSEFTHVLLQGEEPDVPDLTVDSFTRLLDENLNSAEDSGEPLSEGEALAISAVYSFREIGVTAEAVHALIKDRWDVDNHPSLTDVDDWLEQGEQRHFLRSESMVVDKPTAFRIDTPTPATKVFSVTSHPAEVYAQTFRGLISALREVQQVHAALTAYAKAFGLADKLVEALESWIGRTFSDRTCD